MASADIPDLKDRVSHLEEKVGKLQKNANKANGKLGEANASLDRAKDVLNKAKKRKKKAAKKLSRAESDAAAARQDLGMVRFGANMARSLEARTADAETQQSDSAGLIDMASVVDYSAGQPSLVDVSVNASAVEREATMTAVQADWAGAGARAELRGAAHEVSRATVKRDEVATAKQKADDVASKAENKLNKVKNKLNKVESKLTKAVEKKQAAERKAAAEKAARAANRKVMPGTGQTTSPYGMRTHPITGVHKLHSGTDFSYGDGRAYAARSGRVAAITYDGGYGNMVTLSHGNGIQTRYAHLASPTVSEGQKVSAGDVVGQIGSTGYSTGPHLHFEVLKYGDFVNADSWLGQ